MTPEQALQFLDDVAQAQAQNRLWHQKAQAAAEIIANALAGRREVVERNTPDRDVVATKKKKD